MNTEELNDYVFTKIVMETAWKIRCKRVFDLENAGEITDQQVKDIPVTSADLREALTAVRHNKKVLFDILSELESAPAGPSTPPQVSP